MVYVNSKKFACESCIKGHRSSSCHHTDRPLFEIKKKGRPISQCTQCRQLRQSKKFHSKCTCDPAENGQQMQLLASSSGTKSKRYIPIVPALPNGLRDVLQASQSSCMPPPDSRQRVDSLLNPCNCKSVWKCKCTTLKPSDPCDNDGSATLAATLSCCSAQAPKQLSSLSESSFDQATISENTKRPASRSSNRRGASHKRSKIYDDSPLPGPDLPPILLRVDSPESLFTPAVPTFATMPSISTITSLAGSGCTCGVQCCCPGCVEHRGPDHAAKDRNDCADGCGTCIDNRAGIALPGQGMSASAAPSILDRFFARAAALPAPPLNRSMGFGTQLDPMNVMVYPDAAREIEAQGVAFGLVNLPKLECCGGECGCPNGRCGCGKACDGCCADHDHERKADAEDSLERHISEVKEAAPVITPPTRSCCAGKNVSVTA